MLRTVKVRAAAPNSIANKLATKKHFIIATAWILRLQHLAGSAVAFCSVPSITTFRRSNMITAWGMLVPAAQSEKIENGDKPWPVAHDCGASDQVGDRPPIALRKACAPSYTFCRSTKMSRNMRAHLRNSSKPRGSAHIPAVLMTVLRNCHVYDNIVNGSPLRAPSCTGVLCRSYCKLVIGIQLDGVELYFSLVGTRPERELET